MKLKLSLDERELASQLAALRTEDIVSVWSEAILELAVSNAETKIGGRFGRDRIGRFIEVETHGDKAEIRMNRQNAYIGSHVHFGGPIRGKNGKRLAIPLPNEASAKYNPERLFANELKGTVPLFRLVSRKGNALLFRRPGKGEKLEKPLFVLKDETRPQKPRPWWPTQEESERAATQFFEDNF